MKKKYTPQSAFALLFTVLVIGLILSIGIGISNVTLKQSILSALAKDSQIAFYEADSAIECGLLYDFSNAFPRGTVYTALIGSSITCGDRTLSFDVSLSNNNYLVFSYTPPSLSLPCNTILFDKRSVPTGGIVQGFGYNICDKDNPRNVQRALQVTY